MRTVATGKVGTEGVSEVGLPVRVQEALGELAGAAKEGLLALSVGVGLGVLVAQARTGMVESIRMLRITRATAVTARTQALLQIRTHRQRPRRLRDELLALKPKQAAERCLTLRPGTGRDPLNTTKHTLRSLARRVCFLDHEIAELEAELRELIALAAPRLLAQHGVGPECAAKLLTIAGDNPERLRSHGALAALCGVSPVQASSGKTRRRRLNRGGDRQGNNALYTIAMNRMLHHAETKAYVQRRTAEGKTRREIRRCLMRHLARRLFPLLLADLHDAKSLPLLT